ncbi:PIN domain-containing protein [Roseofilum sp. BLCC_M91]|uniref:PIN domain-containing protein n=1 Tax=Roseofilum halophilum BLCC-M91 TaxID=3022259 RepID=A0ABT7BHM1_9CYAN|nr:PIN domain-containing protein [Roseofilum halophilum]MDJ1177996.1 PIN domain-containing protein [Roseofilum halophilum BLCC-M91]
MSDKIFLDTNLWVYLYAKEPEIKYLKVKQVIEDNFESILVSTQILGELFNVLTRKKLVPDDEAQEIVLEVVSNFTIAEIDTLKVLQALDIKSRYQYSYWDSLIIATALILDCTILYSEDLHHDQIIEQKMKIINPFM